MTTKRPLASIILAAGVGSRMKSDLPKVMHQLAGRPMINWVVETAQALAPEKLVVVTGPDDTQIGAAVANVENIETAVQAKPLGTADAVKAGLTRLGGFKGDILVLYGDGPLYQPGTLRALIEKMYEDASSYMGFLAMRPENPTGYGRMITDSHHHLERIVEEKDATAAQKEIDLCWTGVMCAHADKLRSWIKKVGNRNAAGEYYLTDLPAIAASEGNRTVVTYCPFEEALGANTRAELAVLEAKIQNRLRLRAMGNGVTLVDPGTVYFSWDTQIGKETVIEPHVVFGGGVWIDENVNIRAFSHVEGANIAKGAVIGPYARLRPGADIQEDAKIGNFVEIKNAVIGKGSKANHHAYIGDAELGVGVNFSCGAIVANYDGAQKHRTKIADHVMVGSNVTLVAPVNIGPGAYLGAGSTITKDVPADALGLSRASDVRIVQGWAAVKRERDQEQVKKVKQGS